MVTQNRKDLKKLAAYLSRRRRKICKRVCNSHIEKNRLSKQIDIIRSMSN